MDLANLVDILGQKEKKVCWSQKEFAIEILWSEST